jgi:RNA polymerase sigma-70 factor (ECF subfamily)
VEFVADHEIDDYASCPVTAPQVEDDAILVSAAKTGDRAACEKIFVKYRQKIFSISLRYIHDTEEASDIVQETFLSAFKFIYRFNSRSGFLTWLVRICLNICWHRRNRINEKRCFEVSLDKEIDTGEDTVGMQVAFDEAHPGDVMERRQEVDRIRTAVDSLKKKHREIIILKDLEGYSYEQCAEFLAISQGTVMSRLHRARKILMKKLSRP